MSCRFNGHGLLVMKRTFLLSFFSLVSVFGFAAPCFSLDSAKPAPDWLVTGYGRHLDLRTNIRHFWQWSHQQKQTPNLPQVFFDTAWIAADAHADNFAVVRDSQHSGVALVDVDDGGTGPLGFDVIRHVVMSRSQFPHIPIANFVAAYHSGLMMQARIPPERISQLVEVPHQQWMADRKAFFSQSVNRRGKFRNSYLKLQKIEKLSLSNLRDFHELELELLKLFPGATVQDRAFKIKDFGGSRGLPRYWFLLQTKGTSKRPAGKLILELKQMSTAAIEAIAPQHQHAQRVGKLIEHYWQEYPKDLYGVVTLKSGLAFWLRPRITPPLEAKDISEEVDFALYWMWFHGMSHGSQSQAANYQTWVRDNPNEFQRLVEDLSGQYLHLVKSLGGYE